MDAGLQPFADHLEYLGYKITPGSDANSFRAEHRFRFNIRVKRYRGGLLFTAILKVNKDAVKEKPTAYYQVLNDINATCTITRVYDNNTEVMYLEAWYPYVYDKREFPLFIDNWNADFENILSNYDARLDPFMWRSTTPASTATP